MLALLLALVLGACQATPQVLSSDPRVSVGEATTCAALNLSDLRCTFLTLRAAGDLERLRPGEPPTDRAIHAAGTPPADQSPIPASQVAVLVVVFTFADGSRLGVPVLCPREGSGEDPACNPQIQ